MLHRKILIAAALLLAVLLIAATAQAAKPPLTGKDTVAWRLSDFRVVSSGETVEVPADEQTGFPGGLLTTGYTLEAKARSQRGSLVPDGTFQLTFTAFKPHQDMVGQKAGLWHIEGQWTVVDKRASREAQKARHDAYTVEGKIRAALPFNPALEAQNWSALAFLPMSPAAGQWARGSEGVLSFNSRHSRLEGDLLLTLQLWPKNR